VAIDPHASLREDLRSLIQEHQLRLLQIVETHTHADHISSSHTLRTETGARVAMGRHTESARPDRLLAQGDRIQFGTLSLLVIESPGHTPDSICLRFTDESSQQDLLFTGDTLLIGSTGRTDFPAADAGALFDSLRRLEAMIRPETCILPGHDYSDLLFSSVAKEKQENGQFREADREAFIRIKDEEAFGGVSNEIRSIIRFNQEREPEAAAALVVGSGGVTTCGASLPVSERVPSINVQKYAVKLEEKSTRAKVPVIFIDVREPEEFQSGRIPKLENIPLSELVLHWSRLSRAGKVYLSCQGGRRSMLAARTLDRLGVSGVVNVTGGFQAWQSAGFPVAKG